MNDVLVLEKIQANQAVKQNEMIFANTVSAKEKANLCTAGSGIWDFRVSRRLGAFVEFKLAD